MRIFKLAVAAAVALPLAFAGAANAMPVTGDITEGGPSPRNTFPGADLATPVGDFGQPDNRAFLELDGHNINIFGTIQHRNDNLYQDAWTMVVKKVTEITFFWAPHEDKTGTFSGSFVSPFGVFNFGPAASAVGGPVDNSVTGSVVLGTLLPNVEYDFSVDATTWGTPREFGHWQVNATVVPLPAGGILLLTALGGMAVFRSRKKA